MKGQIALLRTYAKRRDIEELNRLADAVRLHLKALERHTGVDELRGLEGIASRITFDGFSFILREPWTWTGRNRRPPKDPVNALLSFGYTMLEKRSPHRHLRRAPRPALRLPALRRHPKGQPRL